MKKSILSLLAICFSASSSFASIIILEPDDYANGTILNTVSPFVTLGVADNSNVSSTFFKVTATPVNSGSAPTGLRVFGNSNIGFLRMRIDFASPTDFVSIIFAADPADTTNRGALDAYNSSGTLIASYLTSSLLANQSETMVLSRSTADIAFAVAYDPAQYGTFGRLDKLSFNVVPEPSSVILLVLGLSILFSQRLGLTKRCSECLMRGTSPAQAGDAPHTSHR